MDPLRVVLAEDDALLRQGVAGLIDAHPDLSLLGAASDYDGLMTLVETERPHVVVTDIRMPPTRTDEGIRAANDLAERYPDIGVVVLSQYVEPSYAIALLGRGAAGRAYLLKERVADIEELAQAIRAVAAGGSVIDPVVVDTLVSARARRPTSVLSRLTPRESETLSEMAKGKSNAAIAGSLTLSERAVEKHINSMFAKLGLTEERDLNKRVMAVLLYLSEHQE